MRASGRHGTGWSMCEGDGGRERHTARGGEKTGVIFREIFSGEMSGESSGENSK